ncbi:uncharacterized protein METZ01_LOCUS391490, partial [marine metagenome]
MNPTNALLLSALIAAALAALLWPEKGLLPRWRHLRHAGERTLLEDALKHLYDCEYLGRSTSVASLSGALQIPQGRATEIIILLESQSLSKSTENGPRLTSSGRDYALRVLRIHRLWEQHLAQRTGVSHSDWHRLA